MNLSVNPSTWASWPLRVRNQNFDTQMQLLLNQISQWAEQIQTTLSSPMQLAAILNGSGALSPSSSNQLSVYSAAETANRTVNALSKSSVAMNFNVTGAINYILTLSNLSAGTIVLLRLSNASGATRTFTVAATGYTVYLIGTGALLQITAGASISSGAAWNGIGIGNTAASQLLLVGGVGT